MIWTFLFLLLGHAIADRPLQGGQLSRDKRSPDWRRRWGALLWHATIHGAMVFAVTLSWPLFVAELVCHTGIDRAKGRGWIDTVTDQLLHVLCKAVWIVVLAWS